MIQDKHIQFIKKFYNSIIIMLRLLPQLQATISTPISLKLQSDFIGGWFSVVSMIVNFGIILDCVLFTQVSTTWR